MDQRRAMTLDVAKQHDAHTYLLRGYYVKRPCNKSHSFQFFCDQPCVFCGHTRDSARLYHDIEQTQAFYANLKATLDERAPA